MCVAVDAPVGLRLVAAELAVAMAVRLGWRWGSFGVDDGASFGVDDGASFEVDDGAEEPCAGSAVDSATIHSRS